MKRRPERPTSQAPERLLRFVAAEWSVPPLVPGATDWQAKHWQHLGPLQAWRDARRAWTTERGAGLGNPLEQLRAERSAGETQRARIRSVANPEDGVGAA